MPPQDQSYSFITNSPEEPKRSPLSFLSGLSLRGRIILGAGGLVAFLILILILRALVGGGGNADVLITVVQDQQELVHLAENAGTEQSLSRKNRNLASTVQLAVASSQSQLVTYLAEGGKRLNEKQLNLKVDATVDQRLTDAASSGTYNQTFEEIMRDTLNEYGQDLQDAYQANKGPNGRAILSDSYNQARLLGIQLNSGN